MCIIILWGAFKIYIYELILCELKKKNNKKIFTAPGDINNETPTNERSTFLASATTSTSDRRSSRDIGVQAFSLEIEEEKKTLTDDQNEKPPSKPQLQQQQPPQAKISDTKRKELRKCKISK